MVACWLWLHRLFGGNGYNPTLNYLNDLSVAAALFRVFCVRSAMFSCDPSRYCFFSLFRWYFRPSLNQWCQVISSAPASQSINNVQALFGQFRVPSPGNVIVTRAGAAMAVDSANQKIYIFGRTYKETDGKLTSYTGLLLMFGSICFLRAQLAVM
jgi:hypothetical protein